MGLEKRFLEVIKDMAKGQPGYTSGRTKSRFSWDDITIIPAQSSKAPFDHHKEMSLFRSERTYATRYSERGINLTVPFVISGMSYGAISRSAKLAIHNAANKLAEEGIVIAVNTGEGGALDFELNERRYVLIGQYASGRFGITKEYLEHIDALEIKIGQGAKTGQGGYLPAKKITPAIAKQRELPEGVDAFSPARHIDIVGPEDLTAKIREIRSYPYWNDKPIFVKYGAANIKADVRIAVKAGADLIIVDGMEGATGAAQISVLNHVGQYTIPSIPAARRAIDESLQLQYLMNQEYDQSVLFDNVDLLASGGIYTVSTAFKALALGADLIGMSTAILVALGCTTCDQCSEGKCSEGIATQNEKLESKLDIDLASERVYNFVKRFSHDLKMLYMDCGYYDYGSTTTEDLRTVNPSISQMTGIKIQGE